MAAKEGLQRLLAASEAGRVLEAQQIFHELQGPTSEPFLWNVVLKASVKAKDWPSAEAWFRQIPARSRSPRSYGKLINCAAQDLRAGGPKQAEAVLRQAERACVTLDAFFYGALLDGCAAAGEPGRATAWMQRLQAHQLYSSVRALTAVARSCAAQGEAEEATAWMEGTEEEDKSMLRLQATAIVAPDEAVQELQKMQQTGRNIHEHSYGAAIRALAQQSDTQGARQLLRQKPTPHNFTTVIGACAKRKEFRVAILLLAEMLEAGLEMELCTWAALLSQTPLAVRWVEDGKSTLAATGDAGESRCCFAGSERVVSSNVDGDEHGEDRPRQDMRHYQLQPDEVIYGAAIAAVARTKEADEALKMLHSMPVITGTAECFGDPGCSEDHSESLLLAQRIFTYGGGGLIFSFWACASLAGAFAASVVLTSGLHGFSRQMLGLNLCFLFLLVSMMSISIPTPAQKTCDFDITWFVLTHLGTRLLLSFLLFILMTAGVTAAKVVSIMRDMPKANLFLPWQEAERFAASVLEGQPCWMDRAVQIVPMDDFTMHAMKDPGGYFMIEIDGHRLSHGFDQTHYMHFTARKGHCGMDFFWSLFQAAREASEPLQVLHVEKSCRLLPAEELKALLCDALMPSPGESGCVPSDHAAVQRVYVWRRRALQAAQRLPSEKMLGGEGHEGDEASTDLLHGNSRREEAGRLQAEALRCVPLKRFGQDLDWAYQGDLQEELAHAFLELNRREPGLGHPLQAACEVLTSGLSSGRLTESLPGCRAILGRARKVLEPELRRSILAVERSQTHATDSKTALPLDFLPLQLAKLSFYLWLTGFLVHVAVQVNTTMNKPVPDIYFIAGTMLVAAYFQIDAFRQYAVDRSSLEQQLRSFSVQSAMCSDLQDRSTIEKTILGWFDTDDIEVCNRHIREVISDQVMASLGPAKHYPSHMLAPLFLLHIFVNADYASGTWYDVDTFWRVMGPLLGFGIWMLVMVPLSFRLAHGFSTKCRFRSCNKRRPQSLLTAEMKNCLMAHTSHALKLAVTMKEQQALGYALIEAYRLNGEVLTGPLAKLVTEAWYLFQRLVFERTIVHAGLSPSTLKDIYEQHSCFGTAGHFAADGIMGIAGIDGIQRKGSHMGKPCLRAAWAENVCSSAFLADVQAFFDVVGQRGHEINVLASDLEVVEIQYVEHALSMQTYLARREELKVCVHPKCSGQVGDAQTVGPLGPWTHSAIRRCQGVWADKQGNYSAAILRADHGHMNFRALPWPHLPSRPECGDTDSEVSLMWLVHQYSHTSRTNVKQINGVFQDAELGVIFWNSGHRESAPARWERSPVLFGHWWLQGREALLFPLEGAALLDLMAQHHGRVAEQKANLEAEFVEMAGNGVPSNYGAVLYYNQTFYPIWEERHPLEPIGRFRSRHFTGTVDKSNRRMEISPLEDPGSDALVPPFLKKLFGFRRGITARLSPKTLGRPDVAAEVSRYDSARVQTQVLSCHAGSSAGSGIYLTDSAVKADQCSELHPNGLCAILICRVCLGRVINQSEGDRHGNSIRRGSEYQSVKLASDVNEYVIFDPSQVYVEYLVWYRRRYHNLSRHERGDLENSKRLVSDMALSKLRPNVVTWTALLTACAVAKPKKREESQRIFRQMVRCNVMPNETTLKTLTWAVGHANSSKLCQDDLSANHFTRDRFSMI
eukprot:g3557.t1